jgi:hypothetical protein
MKIFLSDILYFTGIILSTLQIYKHIKNVKSEGKLKWSEDGNCFMLEDDRDASMLFFRAY